MKYTFKNLCFIAITTLTFSLFTSAMAQEKSFTASEFSNQCNLEDDENSYLDNLQCLQEVEKQLLIQNPDIAKRNGDLLCFAKDTDGAHCYTQIGGVSITEPGDPLFSREDIANYFFAGILPHTKVAVVYSLHYEWSEYRFIATQTGEELLVLSDLYDFTPSPDGQYLALTSQDFFDDIGNPNAIFVYAITKDTPWVKVFELNVQNFAPDKINWVNETLFSVDRKVLTPDNEFKLDGTLFKVRFNGREWIPIN